MKHAIPAAIIVSMASLGLAQAQTSNSVGTTRPTTPPAATTTTPSANLNTAPNTTAGVTGTPSTTGTTGALGTNATGRPNADTSNSAVNTSNNASRNPRAPVPGANSFTEGEARSRIQDKGFGQVTNLKKDDQGIWRGTAMKDGKSTSVALDYQGNVVGQ